MSHGFDAPKGASLVALATRDSACPTDKAGDLGDDVLLDPDGLVVDERFYIHLAQHRGDDRPYRCVASASFRVSERLSARAMDSMRVGLLGDLQAVVFMNRPTAIGAALPLVYARLRLAYGLGIDASASVLSAVALDNAALTRAGVGLSATLYWGPERYAPRIVGFGLLVHATDGTARREPSLSLVTTLNLSTLFDAAGGR